MKLEDINICLGCVVVVIAIYFLLKSKGSEQFATLNKCEAVGRTYCKLMKSGAVDNLGDGARKVLYRALEACGKDGHLDVSECYPNWATRIGGTHYNPLYPQI